MKKILSLISIVALSFSFVACEGLFDNLEGDKSKLSGDYLAESEAGLSRMMASVYASIPMGAFSNGDKSTDNAVDTHGGAIYNSTPGFWNYTTMRDVNNLIKIIDESYKNGKISETLRDTYIAEARFVRAYYYFGMVRTYGGVPIITEPLDDKYDGGENAGLYIPRSTEKETWDFVLAELTEAAASLPESRTDGAYRADKWAALGLKSRVALYAASVSKYWKNAPIETSYQAVADKLTYMEESYANDYYQQCIDACEEIINSGKFSLYNAEPASLDAAITGLSDLFLESVCLGVLLLKSRLLLFKSLDLCVESLLLLSNSPLESRNLLAALLDIEVRFLLELEDLFLCRDHRLLLSALGSLDSILENISRLLLGGFDLFLNKDLSDCVGGNRANDSATRNSNT